MRLLPATTETAERPARPGECRLERIADAAEAAVQLAAWSIGGQAASPLVEPPTEFDPVAAAESALAPFLEGRDGASGWVALDHAGRARALLGARLEVTDEGHPGYTYLPPRYADVPLSVWHLASAPDAELLPLLVGGVAADARAKGVRRLMVQVRPHDWIAGSAWLRLGLRPGTVLAARPTRPALDPGSADVVVRPARPGDEDALVALAFEQYEYHTECGMRSGQAEAPTRRLAEQWVARADPSRAQVALDAAGTPVGFLEVHTVELPVHSPGLIYYPPRYGYIGLTSVTASARGRGVGRALAARALAGLADRGLDYAMLHYVVDNPLSRPFWSGLGFAPHVLTLAGDVLG